MDRNVRALTIALLCVLALSLAAATLTDPQQPPGAGEGSGEPWLEGDGTERQDGTSESGGYDNPEPTNREGQSPLRTACVPMLTSPSFILGLIALVIVVGYAGYRRDGLVPAIVILFVMSTMLIPAWLMLTDCGTEIVENPGGDLVPPLENGSAPGGVVGGASGAETVLSPPVVLAGLLVVALLVSAVVFSASGDDEFEEEPSPDQTTGTPEEETLAALGDVAGEAADRIEASVDAENEVYRAWHEMTTHLDVGNPEASTPTEFAAAARDAGMSETHVETLTRLFQDVRYGGAEPTGEREDRAVDALRAIESAYGGER